ncbi:MAG: substrate-binding domain-containing protein [Pseudomonadota bacterium]
MIRAMIRSARSNALRWVAVLAVALASQANAEQAARSILVQSTTSTKNSGLYDHLIPLIAKDVGVRLDVVAVGTGQAIRNAKSCDGDLLLVHARAAEEAFVAEGYGLARHDLMYNDFVIVGPADDPAGLAGGRDAAAALARIAETRALFASRGDDSGTHVKEHALWRGAGVDPSGASGAWYRETGSGMGATLNAAAGMGAYALTDRATWIAFANKSDLRILVEGDPALFNPYGVIAVNPARCPSAKVDAAQAVIDWLLSQRGQDAIAAYRRDGRRLFFPNAAR